MTRKNTYHCPSLFHHRGLLATSGHRLTDPPWADVGQGGAPRPGLWAHIRWHLPLPGTQPHTCYLASTLWKMIRLHRNVASVKVLEYVHIYVGWVERVREGISFNNYVDQINQCYTELGKLSIAEKTAVTYQSASTYQKSFSSHRPQIPLIIGAQLLPAHRWTNNWYIYIYIYIYTFLCDIACKKSTTK